MFNKQNFCHVASNNRNEQKAGIFVYRTTDNLATVLASGYFNEKLVDINLHDIIIHEQTDNADKTKVQKNVLCVTERTLDNVGTTLVKSQWEEDIESAVESMQDDIEIIQGDIDDIKAKDIEQDERLDDIESGVAYKATDFKTPITSTNKGITQTEETALNNKIDLAANSGRMILDQGVWYAKMYAATVAPAAENGTNYADFSQVDTGGNPIIVLYERQNGAWVETDIIVPPAEYDGYVIVTSKIWDITEQAGQQGGRILWNHQSKEFTPYPQIISFEDIEITGDSTVDMPQNPGANQIVNKDYVDEAIAEIPTGGSGLNVGDIFYTMRNDNNLNGAVECNGATYNTTDFTGAQSIGNLLAAGKIDYISLTDYATEISTKGWCDKIGWDGTGNTQFRVPTLTSRIIQKNNIPVVGNGMALGLINGRTNGKGVLARTSATDYSAGGRPATNSSLPFTITTSGGMPGTVQTEALGVTTEPDNSGIIADTSDTAQQRVMIQLATSATDEALETCTGVLAQVAANTTAIAGADFVVAFQRPTAENNYTWYRKYKSGWVEQGGQIPSTTASSTSKTVNLPITMTDTNYFACSNTGYAGNDAPNYGNVVKSKSTTTITIGHLVNYTTNWTVSGMSAS